MLAYPEVLPQRYLAIGTGVSLLVHAVIGISLLYAGSYGGGPSNKLTTIVVDIAFEPPKGRPSESNKSSALELPEHQIVSPPAQSAENKPNPDARYLSDRDAVTAHEQIRRGDGEEAGAKIGPPGLKQIEASKPKQPQEFAVLRKELGPPLSQSKPLRELVLDPDTVSDKVVRPPKAGRSRTSTLTAGSLSSDELSSPPQVEPFSRAAGSGARILGVTGSMDFLPHLPDGDITLLNTKANVFAVFVRRVAVQVFAQIRAVGWDMLRAHDILGINQECSVSAVLSPGGELLKVKLEGSSSSPRFDELIINAVRRGAKDPNPPPAAALQDGNIHFIFKARSWVQLSGDPRSGAPLERRWLMLATGLE